MKDVCNYSFGVSAKREEIKIKMHAGIFYVLINGAHYARTDNEQKARMCAEAIMKGYEIGRDSTWKTGELKF